MGEKADWQKGLDAFIEKRQRLEMRKEKNDKIIHIAAFFGAVIGAALAYLTGGSVVLTVLTVAWIWLIVMLPREIVFRKRQQELLEEMRKITNPENIQQSSD